MPIQDPGIAVTARPVPTFERQPVPAALQVADALADLNPRLTRYTVMRAERWIDRQLEEGRKAAIEDAADWHRRTVRGEERLGRNHWFRRAYRQQAGQNEGRRIAAEAMAEYANWEGRDSDDPRAFQEWLGGFIRTRTADIDDPDVIHGLTPELGVLTNNLGNAHAAYTAERAEREGNDAIAGAVYDALDMSRDGPLNLLTGQPDGDFSPGDMLNRYVELRDRFFAAGVSRARFDEVFTQAVIDHAISELDVSYLEVLRLPRPGGIPPISDKAGMEQTIADTVNQIESRAASRVIRAAQAEQAARELQAQELFQRIATHLISGGEVTPEMTLEIAAAGARGIIDVREFRELNEAWRAGNELADNTPFRQSVSDLPPDLQLAIYEQGDIRALIRARASGLILDDELFNSALRAAVSRREGEQNQDISRTNLRLRIEDEERSAVARQLLPIFNSQYVDSPAAGRVALNAVMDEYRPARTEAVDRLVERDNISASIAGTVIDNDVAALIEGEITWEDFYAEYGDLGIALATPFNTIRRERPPNQ